MLDKSVRTKREELRNKWAALKEIALDEKNDNSMEIRYRQDEIYKRWDFYNNLIKNIEKEGSYEMQNQTNKQR